MKNVFMPFFMISALTTQLVIFSMDKYKESQAQKEARLNFIKLYTPSSPTFSQNRELAEVLKTRKIRIGIIDAGSPLWSVEDMVSFRSKNQPSQETDFENEHGHAVVYTLIQGLKELFPKANEKFEISFCPVQKEMMFTDCLSWMKENDMDLVNISFVSPSVSKEEFELFHEISKKGVVLTVSSGNDSGFVGVGSLCELKIKNKICVGRSETHTSEVARSSTRGHSVNIYAPGSFLINFGSYSSIQQGTSFSSPYHISQYVKSNINGNVSTLYTEHQNKFLADNR